MASRFLHDINLTGALEANGQPGTSGQILSSTATGVTWIDAGDEKATHIYENVRNDEGSTIPVGTPVYSKGEIGGSERILVGIADASDPAKMPAIGITDTELTTTGATKDGLMTLVGVYNTNLSGFSGVSENDIVYVAIGGGLTITKPTGVNLIQNVGIVLKTNGTIIQGLQVACIGRTNDVPTPLYVDHANQRLGIGTTSPQDVLHVTQGSDAFRGITIEGANPGLYLKDTGATSAFHIANNGNSLYFLKDSDGNGTYNSILGYWHSSDNFIFNVGNVGIGTSSPSYKLDVNGGGIRATRSNAGWAGWFENTGNSSGVVVTAGVDSGDAPLLIRKQDGTELFSVRGNGTSWFKNGNVGIGTTSPNSKLEVNVGTDQNVAINSHNSIARISSYNDAFTASEPLIINGSDLRFDISGSEKMRIASGGNVGIGTSNPAKKLHISDSSRVDIKFTTVGSEEHYIRKDGDFLRFRGHDDSAVLFELKNNTNGSNAASFPSGNLGIGTSSPAYKLDVSSGSAVGARISTSGFSNLDLVSSRTSGNLGGIRFKQDVDAYQTGEFLGLHGGGFEWKTSNGTASPTSRMILNTSGNVGIATGSPTEKLQVNGNIKVGDGDRIKLGDSDDLEILHSADGYITNNSGTLYIQTLQDDGDIIFRSDDGSGGITDYLRLDGGVGYMVASKAIRALDGVNLQLGASADFTMQHNGANTILQNFNGNLEITQGADDGDIVFSSDDGSGGTTPYITLDGSVVETKFNKDIRVIDNEKIIAGTSNDLEIFSSGASVLFRTWSGNMTFQQNYNDGDIIFQSDDGSGGVTEYFRVDGSSQAIVISKATQHGDNVKGYYGAANDLQIYHNGTDSVIDNTAGDFYISQKAADKDLIFRADDGAGGFTPYLTLDGSDSKVKALKQLEVTGGIELTNGNLNMPDNSIIRLGSSTDLQIYHNGTNSNIINYAGDLVIRNGATDKDIILQSDDGSGGETAYLTLDGSETKTIVSQTMEFQDNVKLAVGNSEDLIIDHNATDSRIINYTGDLRIVNSANDKDITLESDDGSGGITPYLTLDGSTAKSYFSTRLGVGIANPISSLHVYEDNTAASSTAGLTIEQRGTGDAVAQFLLTGVRRWVIGADNSDSDKFKIASSSGLDSDAHLTVDTSGNVGIGTTSPVNKIQANYAPVAITSLTATAGTASTNWNRNAFLMGTGASVSNALAFGVYGTANDRKTWIQSGHPDSAANSLGTISLNPLGGNVGIGTTSPNEKLEVAGNIGINQYLLHNGDLNTFFGFPGNDTASIGTNGSERMRITSTGNVGIGTTSPSTRLHVSSVSSNDQLTLERTGAFTGKYTLHTANNNFYIGNNVAGSIPLAILNNGNVGIGTTSPAYKLDVRNSSTLFYGQTNLTDSTSIFRIRANGGSSEILEIKANGNIGIGTASPSSTLDVNGAITLSGSSNEIIKSNGSIRLNIDSDNNQGDRIFIVSHHSNTELFRVDEGGHGEFQGNATVNGSIELGHASDTTIARSAAGKVTIEGAPIQTTQMSMSHHNFYFNTSSTTIDYFVPFNSLTESSNPTVSNYYGRMVAPYDGRIVKAVINTTQAIGTACSAQFWVATSSGTFAPSPAETVSNINLNTANAAATATFSGTSTAEFSEGDVVGLSIQKSGTTSIAYIQVTIVWEYTV